MGSNGGTAFYRGVCFRGRGEFVWIDSMSRYVRMRIGIGIGKESGCVGAGLELEGFCVYC